MHRVIVIPFGLAIVLGALSACMDDPCPTSVPSGSIARAAIDDGADAAWLTDAGWTKFGAEFGSSPCHELCPPGSTSCQLDQHTLYCYRANEGCTP